MLYYYFFKASYERRTIHLPLDQYSSKTINYEHYRMVTNEALTEEEGQTQEEEKIEKEEKNKESKDIKELHLEEIKKNMEQAKECQTAKTPGFYENHSYFCPLITSNLSGLWIPSQAKKVLGEENLKKIGCLPDNENYESIKEKYKLREEDLKISYYFDDQWK